MQEIFNEGRVVGLSAYEVYVRHHMEEFGDDPENPPASERAWLASSITFGSSLLIKISSEGPYAMTKTWQADRESSETYWGVELKIPYESRLCCASHILASIFLGKGEVGKHAPFCDTISDYGFLSSDTGQSNYDTMTMNPSDITYYDSQLREYSKLIDGIVIQPITDGDQRKYIPNLHDSPKIRLLFREQVSTPFYLLLTGFSDCSVINGTALHFKGSRPTTSRPDTGDFLGPNVFPWSSKIIISVPASTMSRLFAEKMTRQLIDSTSSTGSTIHSEVKKGKETNFRKIKGDAVIDMNHSYLPQFYNDRGSMQSVELSRLYENVTRFLPLSNEIDQLAVVSRDEGNYDIPALFGAVLKGTGYSYLYPIDCAAPGTVKAYPETAFSGGTAELQNFFKNRPGCYALIMRDGTEYTVYRLEVTSSGEVHRWPVADMNNGDVGITTTPIKKVGSYIQVKAGKKSLYALRIDDISNNPASDATDSYISENSDATRRDIMKEGEGDYPTGTSLSRMGLPTSGTVEGVNYISLRTISYAIKHKRRLDLLGKALRKFRNNIQIDEDKDDTIKCYVKFNFSKPIVFTNKVTFEQPIYIKNTSTFEKDATFTENINVNGNAKINGHLQLAKHVTSCRGQSSRTGGTQEVHIDLLNSTSGAIEQGFAIGANSYITMTNGLRLYIGPGPDGTAPQGDDIPIGSIGIGW